jgi:hypothetical protein
MSTSDAPTKKLKIKNIFELNFLKYFLDYTQVMINGLNIDWNWVWLFLLKFRNLLVENL